LLLPLFFLTGCASRAVLQAPDGNRCTAEDVIHLHIDRSSAWESLFAAMKVKLEVGDNRWSASGSLQYQVGEQISFQFRKPYRLVLGDVFLTPTRLVYWPPFSTPQVFEEFDSLSLVDFFPLELPDWDVRDIMPFPFGARSSGFQLDTVITSGETYLLNGRSANARHFLVASAIRGEILTERIEREGREPLLKTYRKYVIREDWLVPTEVQCETEESGISLTWKLIKPALRAAPRNSKF
jgi:hypothetical protein